MIKAVIDIGTNSTRLYVAEINCGVQNKLTKLLSTTRLGEGILNSGIMGEAPMARTSDKVAEFKNIASQMGADEIFIYATAVVREAENKDEFCNLIYEKTGIVPEVIAGGLEGRIAFMGASIGFNDPAVIDIGGGSTEVVTAHNGVLRALSQKTGGVRLMEQFATKNGIIDIEPVKEFVKANYLADYGAHTDIRQVKTLIGVSGTPTTLASLYQGLKVYVPEKIQGFTLNKQQLDEILTYMAGLNSLQRMEFSGEFKPRADIIVFGGAVLSAFMEFYGFYEVTASDRDSLEGFLEYKLNL